MFNFIQKIKARSPRVQYFAHNTTKYEIEFKRFMVHYYVDFNSLQTTAHGTGKVSLS